MIPVNETFEYYTSRQFPAANSEKYNGVKTLPLFFALFCLTGCAGPMTPFGAQTVLNHDDPEAESTNPAANISFRPTHQILHAAFSFTAVIDDPQGIPDDYRIRVIYNGYDVTREFLAHAQRSFTDLTGRKLKLTFEHLRLPPRAEHRIKFIYYRSAGEKAIVAEYRRPSCPVFQNDPRIERDVANVPGFLPPAEVIDLINFHSAHARINPHFIAGLIAEESGFDPLAVSNKKAVGLTQITSVGEAEILKANMDWPRYPGLAEMPYPFLKLAVLNRRIHAGNEWRLDPSLSIKGGVEYVSYLADYWSRPEKHSQLKFVSSNLNDAFSDALLASYNAGPTRVSQAIERSRKKWFDDDEISGVLRYIRRAESFCDQFAEQRN